MRDRRQAMMPEYKYEFKGETFTRLRSGTRVRKRARLGRNEPCHCGSGKKYKRCCLNSETLDDKYEVLV